MYLRLSPYREVLQGVIISLQINEGIIKITGKSGAGKTALCSQLFQELQSTGQPSVFFLKPPSSAVALQNAILDNLRLDPTGNFTRTLTAYLLARSDAQKPLVLIFDDAQQLDPQTFSAIRMLCNIQDQSRALVRVVLCGNEELDEKLAGPALRAVTQFLNQSFTLPYLTREQMHDFCQAYWLQNDQDMKPLSARNIERLFDETKGHPGILQARLKQGTTGAEPGDRQKDSHGASAPTRPYRYAGRRQGWVPALLIVVGLALLGGAGAYLYLSPRTPAATTVSAGPEPREVAAATAAESTPAVAPEMENPTPVAAAPETEDLSPPAAPETGALTAVAAPETESVLPAASDVGDESSVESLPQADPAAPPPALEPAIALEEEASVDASATQDEVALPSVEDFIAEWTASWQRQDVDAYLAHYAPDFVPSQGTQEQWRAQRRRVISNACDIMISADPPEFTSDAEDEMRVVRFWLNYTAANYADRTLKELVLVPVDGTWRIRAETNLRTEPR